MKRESQTLGSQDHTVACRCIILAQVKYASNVGHAHMAHGRRCWTTCPKRFSRLGRLRAHGPLRVFLGLLAPNGLHELGGMCGWAWAAVSRGGL
jgi:hypothetical protein